MINVMDYECLVYSIIKKYKGDFNDLYQVGMLGLVEAYNHYDPSGGAKFSTYAYFYILGEVNKYIRENKNLKVSRDNAKLYRTIEKARELLRQKLSHEPSDFELSCFLEIDMNTISKINSLYAPVASLDSEFDDVSFYDTIKVYDRETNSDFMDLSNAIESLDDYDRQIIYDRYYNGYTQSEVSKNLGISQVQVSRKENKILQKLKVKL